MPSDELLQALARLAADQESSVDPRLERLARQQLAPSELEALEREASSDARTALAQSLFEPVGDSSRAAMVEKARSLLPQREDASALKEPNNVVPIWRRWLRRTAAVVAPLAIAAALILTLRPTGPGELSPIPHFELHVGGGMQTERAIPSAHSMTTPLVLSPAVRIDLVLQPSVSVSGPLSAQAYFVRGREVHPWDVSPEVSEDGAIRILRNTAGPLPAAPGRWELWVLVGRPEAMPSDSAALLHMAETANDSARAWQLMRRPIRIVAPTR